MLLVGLQTRLNLLFLGWTSKDLKVNKVDIEDSLKNRRCPIHNITFLFRKKIDETKEYRKEIFGCPIEGCSVEALYTINLSSFFDEEEFEISNGPDKLIDSLMDCENKNKKIEWELSNKGNEYCIFKVDGKTYAFTIFKSKFGTFSISISGVNDEKPQYKNGFISINDAKKCVNDWYTFFLEHTE